MMMVKFTFYILMLITSASYTQMGETYICIFMISNVQTHVRAEIIAYTWKYDSYPPLKGPKRTIQKSKSDP